MTMQCCCRHLLMWKSKGQRNKTAIALIPIISIANRPATSQSSESWSDNAETSHAADAFHKTTALHKFMEPRPYIRPGWICMVDGLQRPCAANAKNLEYFIFPDMDRHGCTWVCNCTFEELARAPVHTLACEFLKFSACRRCISNCTRIFYVYDMSLFGVAQEEWWSHKTDWYKSHLWLWLPASELLSS